MGGRIIVVLAIVIIIISGTGIFLIKDQRDQEAKQNVLLENGSVVVKGADGKEQVIQPEPKIDAEVFVLVKDIEKGQTISDADIKVEKRTIKMDEVKQPFVMDKPVSYVVGALANADMPSGNVLTYDDITRDVLADDDILLEISNPKDLAFRFPLRAREFDLVRNVKKGESVDVYFRYELKPSEKDKIVSRGSDDSLQQSRESANLSKMVLMFKDKKVLNIKNKNTSSNTPAPIKGVVTLQMSPNDIKTVYSIENLGRFYIFPSQDDSTSGISTKQILPRDFIKEIRGGEK